MSGFTEVHTHKKAKAPLVHYTAADVQNAVLSFQGDPEGNIFSTADERGYLSGGPDAKNPIRYDGIDVYFSRSPLLIGGQAALHDRFGTMISRLVQYRNQRNTFQAAYIRYHPVKTSHDLQLIYEQRRNACARQH